jgi:hypothetical protein
MESKITKEAAVVHQIIPLELPLGPFIRSLPQAITIEGRVLALRESGLDDMTIVLRLGEDGYSGTQIEKAMSGAESRQQGISKIQETLRRIG